MNIATPGPGTFWSMLGPQERATLHTFGSIRKFSPGETICDRDLLPERMTILLDGYAKEVYGCADGEESLIEIYGPGHLEGELGLWEWPNRARVVALTTAHALLVANDAFESFLAEEITAGQALMRGIGHRHMLVARRHAPASTADGQTRTALHLIELALRFGQQSSGGIVIGPPITQADLASFMGVNRVTVNRALHPWRNRCDRRKPCEQRHRDIVTYQGAQFVITDLAALRAEAGPWASEWGLSSFSEGGRRTRSNGASSGGRSRPRANAAGPDGMGPQGNAAGPQGYGPTSATGTGRANVAGPTGMAVQDRAASGVRGRTGTRRAVLAIPSPQLGAGPAQLPADIPFFTGRGHAVHALDALLDSPDRPRTVIVHGMAGVGKSALVTHWGHAVKDEHFSGGQLYLDLRAAGRPLSTTETIGALVRALEAAGRTVPSSDAELLAVYRRHLARRRLLIVLENADDAEQIRPLIPPSNRSLLVVTTQSRLSSDPGLEASDGVEALELSVMPQTEAVQLVATVLGPGDPRVREHSADIARLVRHCALLPLALRITAAKLAESPQERIADTVREMAGEDPLSHFMGDEPGAAVRPAFELAYRALPPPLRRTFRRLSLATGPDIGVEAAAALLHESVPDTLEQLLALDRAHLLTADGQGRYAMHELLRAFARERMMIEDNVDDRTQTARRLLTYYLATARLGGDAIAPIKRRRLDGTSVPSREVQEAERDRHLAWFESERRNLVDAVRQAARHGFHAIAFDLSDATMDFMTLRGYARDNIAMHKVGLGSAHAVDDWNASAQMLLHLAIAHRSLGQNVRALSYGEDARLAFQRLNDPHGEAIALDNLADVRGLMSRYRLAIEHAEDALRLHRRTRNLGGIAEATDTICQNRQRLGEYGEAEEYALRALDMRRDILDRPGEAETLFNLAKLYTLRGNLQQGHVHALESLSIRFDLGDRPASADPYLELARVHRQLGLRELARLDAGQALRIYQASGDRHGEGEALIVIGKLLRDEGKFPESLLQLWNAVRLTQQSGHKRGEAEARAAIGIVYFKRGRYSDSREHLNMALELRREIGDRAGEAADLEQLSMTLRRLARYGEALQHGNAALLLWQELEVPAGEARTLGSLARTYIRLDMPEEALHAAETAMAIRERIGDARTMGRGYDTMARVLRKMGQLDEALSRAVTAVRLIREVEDRQSEGPAINTIAEIFLDLDRPDEAERYAKEALDIVTEVGDLREQASCWHTLGLVAQHRQDHLAALRDLEQNLLLHGEARNRPGQIETLRAMRISYAAVGDVRAVAECDQRVRGILRWLGSE